MSVLLQCECTVAICVYCCNMSVLLQCECTVAIWVYCCNLSVLLQYECTVAIWVYCCNMSVLLQYECTVAIWVYCCNMSVLLQYAYTVAIWVYCCNMSFFSFDSISWTTPYSISFLYNLLRRSNEYSSVIFFIPIDCAFSPAFSIVLSDCSYTWSFFVISVAYSHSSACSYFLKK